MNLTKSIENKKTHLFYIDLFRAFIIVLMIQGHLFRALLSTDIKKGLIFSIHEYIHGLVAPGFLFLSGFLFFYTIRNKSGKEILLKLKVYAGIVFIGYFLHLPFFSLSKLIGYWGEGAAEKFLYMDILQAIGYSLIISAIFWIISKRFFLHFIKFMVLLNLVLCFLQPKTQNFFFSYFIDQNVSQFPLFPWSLFFFLGILASGLEDKYNKIIFPLSVLLMIFASDLNGFFSKLISDSGKLLFSYSVFLHLKKPKSTIPLMEKFLLASKESLFLYVAHIMIIYGSVLNIGLVKIIGTNHRIPFITFVFFLFLFILYTSAYLLNELKHEKQKNYKLIKNGLLLFLLLIFLLRKY